MIPTLQTYLLRTQRLLHDTNNNFWTTTELTDYINQARNRTVLDSGCLRSSETVSLIQGQETYSYPTGVMEVINIWYLYGNINQPIRYYPFSNLTAKFRNVTNFQSLPLAWGQQQQTIYIEPIPSQALTATFDCKMFPADMILTTDIETIPYPFPDSVPFYAAYLAILKQSDLQKAQYFMGLYIDFLRANISSKTVKGAFRG